MITKAFPGKMLSALDNVKLSKTRYVPIRSCRTRVVMMHFKEERRRHHCPVSLLCRRPPITHAVSSIGPEVRREQWEKEEEWFDGSTFFEIMKSMESKSSEVESDLDQNVLFYTQTIYTHAKSGDMTKAKEVFNEMLELGFRPNVITYTTLMRGCCLLRDIKGVFKWYERMKKDEVAPNLVTMGTLISACAFKGDMLQAFRVLNEFRKIGLEPDIIVLNSLMQVCIKAGKLETTERVFKEMDKAKLKKTLVSYKTMFDAYAKLARISRKEDTLEKCKKLKQQLEEDGLKCDLQTYNILIRVSIKMSFSMQAWEWFAEMKESGEQPDVVTYCTIMDGYARHDHFRKEDLFIQRCLALITDMNETGVVPNLHIYNCMMNVFTKGGYHAEAVEVLSMMKKEGVQPDIVTYGTLIDSCVRRTHAMNPVRYLDDCMKYVDEMRTCGLAPNCRIFSTLINACANVGDTISAEKFVIEMESQGIEVNLVVHVTMMKAYLKTDSYTGASEWLERLKASKLKLNAYPFNLMIGWSMSKSHFEDAVGFISVMRELRIRPDKVTKRHVWRLRKILRTGNV